MRTYSIQPSSLNFQLKIIIQFNHRNLKNRKADTNHRKDDNKALDRKRIKI